MVQRRSAEEIAANWKRKADKKAEIKKYNENYRSIGVSLNRSKKWTEPAKDYR